MNAQNLVRRLGWEDHHRPPRIPKVGNFGDSPELSRELLSLVREGRKTATASLFWEWEEEGQTLPVPGDAEIVLDWDRNPVMVIEYTAVAIKPFLEVPEDFAFDEGEGDRSLASWREAHWAFFTRACRVLGLREKGTARSRHGHIGRSSLVPAACSERSPPTTCRSCAPVSAYSSTQKPNASALLVSSSSTRCLAETRWHSPSPHSVLPHAVAQKWLSRLLERIGLERRNGVTLCGKAFCFPS